MVKILDLGISVWNLVYGEGSGDISLQSGETCRGIAIWYPKGYNSSSHNSFSRDYVVIRPKLFVYSSLGSPNLI